MDRRLFPRRLFAAIPMGLALAAAPAWAGMDDLWVPSAGLPSGGAVIRLAIDPSTPTTLYAVSAPGLYESTDSGAHWRLSLPLFSQSVDDVVVAPGGATVYAAANNYGVYKTADGGNTWTAMNDGLPTDCGGVIDNIMRVFVDPVNASVVYAVALNACASNPPSTPAYGLYKTSDGGAHWHAINTGIGPGSAYNLQQLGVTITGLAADPSNTQDLYLSVEAYGSTPTAPISALSGVYKSVDGGGHWTPSVTNQETGTVAVDPSNSQNIYATGTDGIHLSTDAGATWNLIGASGQPYLAGSLRFDASDSQHLWAAGADGTLEESHDGGANFSTVDTGKFGASDVAVDPVTPSNLFVASSGYGVGCSSDGGTTWNECSSGIHDVEISGLLMGSDGTLYLATAATGIFTSPDQGATWTEADAGIGAGGSVTVRQFIADPSMPGTLYAATNSGLYKSTDGAVTWNLLTGAVPGLSAVNLVTVAPEDSNLLYVWGLSDVYKSTDAGVTWNPLSIGLPNSLGLQSLAVDPKNDQVVYGGTGDLGNGIGLYKTSDGGATWARLSGLPNCGIMAIAIDPVTPTTLYVSGDTNTPVPGQPGWHSIDGMDVYKSTDGGKTWASSSVGIDPGFNFDSLQVDPNDSDYLYATGPGGPFFASGDAGATWNLINDGSSAASRFSTHDAVTLGVRHPVAGARSASAGSGSPAMMTATLDPRHKGMIYGAATDGGVYAYHYVPWKVTSTSAGNPSAPPSAKSSGGGGDVSLFTSLLLLGFALRRRLN